MSGGDLIRQPDGQQGLPQGSDIPVNQIPDLGMSDGTLKTAPTVRTLRAANRPADTLEGLPRTGHRGGKHRMAPRRRAKAELGAARKHLGLGPEHVHLAPGMAPTTVRGVRIIVLAWSPVTESNRRPSPYHNHGIAHRARLLH